MKRLLLILSLTLFSLGNVNTTFAQTEKGEQAKTEVVNKENNDSITDRVIEGGELDEWYSNNSKVEHAFDEMFKAFNTEEVQDSIETVMELVIFTIVIIIIALLVFIMVVTSLIFKYKEKRKQYDTMAFASQQTEENKYNALSRNRTNKGIDLYIIEKVYSKGVKQVLTGIALAIFLYLLDNSLFLASIGLFVVASGVSNLLKYQELKSLAIFNNETEDSKQENQEQE